MTVNGIDIEVKRKNIKNMHLSVYPPDGKVRISVPNDFADDRIEMYVLQKWVWIAEKREEMKTYSYQPERKFVSGEAHYLKGQLYRLKVNRLNSGAFNVNINRDYIEINVHKDTSQESIKATLYEWYKEKITPIIEKLITKWEEILGVKLLTWEVRVMTARWGTCSKNNSKAIFNVELAKKPVECIEYVVAHELIHLIERNHTDRFKRLLDTYLPSWMETKKKLNEFPI